MNYLVLFSVLILNYIYLVYGQVYFQAYNFKPDRNSDFGLYLPEFLDDIFEVANLDLVNGVPEYCCGDAESHVISDGTAYLSVHNSTTFGQYWTGSADMGFCNNYGILLGPFTHDVISDYQSSYTIATETITNNLIIQGFNNHSMFPNYIDDPYTYLFCWHAQFTISRIIGDNSNTVFINTPGELIVYIDGQKQFESFSVSGRQFYAVDINTDENLHTLDLFGCSRSNDISDISIEFSEVSESCNTGNCGTCGPSQNCESECIDLNPTSCTEIKFECGSCISSPRDCDDFDVCTEDSCSEGLGCIHTPIDGCEKCIDGVNCGGSLDTDQCNPHHCVDDLCIPNPVICVGNSSCLEPYCLEGECICSSITTTSETIATTTATTIATTTASTITSSTTETTTGSTIATTSSTISPSTIATTTASTIATTTASTIATITTSTSGASSITNTGTIISSTSSHNNLAQCNQDSCPHHYCCIQLNSNSFSCVSKYFDDNCSERLKDIY